MESGLLAVFLYLCRHVSFKLFKDFLSLFCLQRDKQAKMYSNIKDIRNSLLLLASIHIRTHENLEVQIYDRHYHTIACSNIFCSKVL